MYRTRIAAGFVMLLGSIVAHTAGAESSSPAFQAFRRGQEALANAHYEEASRIFSKLCEQAPDWGLAQLSLGIAEARMRPDGVRAVTALKRAVKLNPKNPRARYFLGATYFQQGHFEIAATHLNEVRRLRPGMRDSLFLLGGALDASKRDDDAIAVFEEVLQGTPGHMGALSALARLYEGRERPQEAEEALQTIAGLQPTVAYHQYQLAQFYERAGDSDKAKVAFRRADKIDPRPKRRMRRLR